MLQSKKFAAFLIAEILWKVIIVCMLIFETPTIAVLVAVITAGAVECLYIGSQAALDKYLKGAKGIINEIKNPV
jgi:hypothetical protein